MYKKDLDMCVEASGGVETTFRPGLASGIRSRVDSRGVADAST